MMTHDTDMNNRPGRGPSRMAGMTLVELMVAVTIGLLLLAGVTTVFVNSSSARNELERSSRQIENGRYASQILTDDIRLAGYYGEFAVNTAAVPGALPDPCSTTLADWVSAIPLHLQGYPNGAGVPACVPASLKANTDVVVVRRLRTCAAGVAGCPTAVNGAPYMQVSLCATESATTPYVLGLSGTATYNLRIKDCSTAAALRQYEVSIYFISTDNGAGQNVPTLKKLELTGSGGGLSWTEIPLVEGIEDFHVEYGLDTNGDGLPDSYTSNPGSVANWMNAMTVRFYILARNIDPTPFFTDTKTYNLGTVTVAAPGDGYHRHVFSGVVRILNPAGRRDFP